MFTGNVQCFVCWTHQCTWMLLSRARRPGWGCHITLKWTTVEWSAVFAFKAHFHSHLRHNSWVHIRPSSVFHHGWWRFPHLASVKDQLMIPYWDLWIKQWSESNDNKVQYTCYLLKWQNISQSLSEKCPGHISPPKN